MNALKDASRSEISAVGKRIMGLVMVVFMAAGMVLLSGGSPASAATPAKTVCKRAIASHKTLTTTQMKACQKAKIRVPKKQQPKHHAASAAPATTPLPTTTTAPAPTTTTAPPKPQLTQQQQSALTAAKQYLSTSAFSQQGLIDQLDSSAGTGYSVTDATVAVNSLNVNWTQEAVKSAKQYMQQSPFSCQDLITQLDSSAGTQYTAAQATYGAHQAGDCGA
jgi:hypothetical protein